MGKFKINPAVEVKQFCPVKAGTYRMKIADSKEKTSDAGNQYIEWRLSFVDGQDRLLGINGQALAGNPGSVFLRTMLNPDQQWKLRALIEGALGEWRDFDSSELYGKEIDAVVGEEEYQGEIRNVITRVVLKK
jgi:hypothetical protein